MQTHATKYALRNKPYISQSAKKCISHKSTGAFDVAPPPVHVWILITLQCTVSFPKVLS